MRSKVTRATDQLREMARRTPDSRERTVDLVRALSIASVVLGHWLLIAITETNGVYDGGNALRHIEWAHPLTWLFQVMPLFFLVGGYSNAASMRAHEDAGGDAGGWLLGRFDRILRPIEISPAAIERTLEASWPTSMPDHCSPFASTGYRTTCVGSPTDSRSQSQVVAWRCSATSTGSPPCSCSLSDRVVSVGMSSPLSGPLPPLYLPRCRGRGSAGTETDVCVLVTGYERRIPAVFRACFQAGVLGMTVARSSTATEPCVWSASDWWAC